MFQTQFKKTNSQIREAFRNAPIIRGAKWQSTDAPDAMVELYDYSIRMQLNDTNLQEYREALRPNLPWADHHFERERVSGDPINPGETFKYWFSGPAAKRFLTAGGQFSHSYAERYWPRFAGQSSGGELSYTPPDTESLQGIRFRYGDLDDLVNLLVREPLTRQAYLPVWFPEDLGATAEGERVPCSLGYHFMMRQDELSVIYYMRSCDYVRHFRDDIYLTIRLLLWVLDQCQCADPEHWMGITPGRFTMHISSLHMFGSDREIVLK